MNYKQLLKWIEVVAVNDGSFKQFAAGIAFAKENDKTRYLRDGKFNSWVLWAHVEQEIRK